jgi:hypothetical protein
MFAILERLLAALFSLNKRPEYSETFTLLESNSRQNLQEIDDLKKLNFQKI